MKDIEALQKNWKTFLAPGTNVPAASEALKLSDDEWKKRLQGQSYSVLRKEATERGTVYSTKELERRLTTRAQDPPQVVAQRMAKAADEMSHYDAYDYIVINRDLERSVSEVQSVLAAERLQRRRLVGLSDFVNRLREGH